MYSATELQRLHRAGQAHKLPSGAILPTRTPEEVATAIRQAKAAHGTGSDEDDPGYRSHLVQRAAAHGMQRLVPSMWTRGRAGKSAAASGLTALAKSAASPGTARSVYIDTPALDELGRSRSCDEGITKLIQQGRLGELQKDIARIDEASRALRDGAVEKAARYDRMASVVFSPAEAENYRQLAAAERRKAGIA